MLVSTLKKEIALSATDPTMRGVSSQQYLVFINQAVDDLIGYGWLTPIAEETIDMVADTYDYAIPASWAYIRQILYEDSLGRYGQDVPDIHWRLSYGATGAQISFDPQLWAPDTGYHIKLIGQKRPSRYTTDAEVVEDLFVAFIRERASSSALEYMACQPIPNASLEADEMEGMAPPAGRRQNSNLLPMRIQQLHAVAQMKWQHSHLLASCHPMEFRCKPSSKHVPGR